VSRVLRFGRKAAQSGQARSLVVFLHGYGADGADLLSLAEVLAPHLPDTAFVAPDAAERIPGAPFGRQWFAIPRFDGSTAAEAEAGLVRSTADLNDFLDQRLSYEGLGPQALALIGFSQGAMMGLHVAPRRADPVAALVAISGQLLQPERLPLEARVKPPVLVMHGDADAVVPFAEMTLACNALASAGFDTYGHVMQGAGHGIAQDGLATALAFLQKTLPGAPSA
jgi:phospholipase/carboxylesterase